MLDLRLHVVASTLAADRAVEQVNALATPFAAVVDQATGKYVGALTEAVIRARQSELLRQDPAAALEIPGRPRTAEPTALDIANREYPTAAADLPLDRRIELLAEAKADYLPLLDEAGRLVGIDALHELLHPPTLENLVVFMAGGLGTRLWPVTENKIPKALVRVGPRSLIETMIDRLRGLGFRRFALCVHHLSRPLIDTLGDGSRQGISLRYISEDEPLGTAGGLGLIEPPEHKPLLVLNGDVLTRHDVSAMLRVHEAANAAATVAVRAHVQQVPFGVVEVDDAGQVTALREKPVRTVLVNAGIYILSPRALRPLVPAKRIDMTSLLSMLIASGERVLSHPVVEYWMDVGTPASYQEATQYVTEHPI